MLFRKSTAVGFENHVKCLKTWRGQKEAWARVLFNRVKSLRQLKDGLWPCRRWSGEALNLHSGASRYDSNLDRFADCPKILCDFLSIIGETENRTTKPITTHVYHSILFDDLYYYCNWNSVVK